jgi:hypothetical protein
MSNANDMKQLRGPKHGNWPVCDPRAAPPGELGNMALALEVVKIGHLARANGRPMAHLARQPGPVRVEGGVSRWLAGVVGLGVVGWGGGGGWWSCTSATTRGVGRFFNSST